MLQNFSPPKLRVKSRDIQVIMSKQRPPFQMIYNAISISLNVQNYNFVFKQNFAETICRLAVCHVREADHLWRARYKTE